MSQKAKERSMIIIIKQKKIKDVENKRSPDLILYKPGVPKNAS